MDLGTLGGVVTIADAINDRGEVAGRASTPDEEVRGFLWTPERALVALELLPGGRDAVASDINNRGEIVGYSDDANSETRAVVWFPR